jgi:glutamate synthase (NADPH/NADH) small chain
MAKDMLQFVTTAMEMPVKREAVGRREDFGEIYREFAADTAAVQASRCSQCGVPFCQVHCPLHNNIPDWLMLTAEGRLEEAYELAQATNTFPEICGRICPQDRLCEGNCVIEQAGHGTVTAGLAAADRLRRRGYQVVVYDRYDRAGGLLVYGIPNFKLEKHVVERRTRWLESSGVEFKLNFEVGRDASFEAIRAQHDALLIATGVYRARDVSLPGSGLADQFQAMTYLTASNRKGLGDAVPRFEDGTLNAAGKRVVVIGGGDTAMDCVRTAVRQGAASVRCLYRRDRENMPGSRREVTNAEEEGVEFVWLATPEAFLGDERVSAVRVARIHLGMPDATGRQAPQIVEGSSYAIEADIVIKALGFDPEDLPRCFENEDLALTRWGTVRIGHRSKMTSLDGVFAAGDIVRGASLVVWAIRDGRDAADAIDAYIEEKTRAAEPKNRAVA